VEGTVHLNLLENYPAGYIEILVIGQEKVRWTEVNDKDKVKRTG
jgi:hypothetical protein